MNLGHSIYTMYNKLYTINLTTTITTYNIEMGTNNPYISHKCVCQGYLYTSAGLAWKTATHSPLHGWLHSSPIMVTQKCVFIITVGDNCMINQQAMEKHVGTLACQIYQETLL